MRGHNICLNGQIWNIISKLSLLPLPIWSTVGGCMNVDLLEDFCCCDGVLGSLTGKC